MKSVESARVRAASQAPLLWPIIRGADRREPWSRRGRLAKQVPGGVIRACIVIRAERGAPFFGPVIWIHSIGLLCLTRMEERARMYAMFALLRCGATLFSELFELSGRVPVRSIINYIDGDVA